MLNGKGIPTKNNRRNFRWTLDKKIGGLATVLLVLLGGLSSYFYFEISKICRELNEITQNDIPIYQTTNKLITYHNQKKLILEQISFAYHNYKFHNDSSSLRLNLSEITDKLEQLEQATSKIVTFGIKKTQFAIAEEDYKSQLSQDREDYQRIQSLLIRLELGNQEFKLIVKQLLQQAFHDQTISLIQQAQLKLKDYDRFILEINQLLNDHIDIAVNQASQNRAYEIRLIIIISFCVFVIGLTIATVITQQIKFSVNKVTKKAKFIAKNIDRDNFSHQALVIDSNDEIGDLSTAFNQMIEKFLVSQTERENMSKQLLLEKKIAQWEASHDTLTDLVNRREFESRLSQILESEESTNHSLLYLDLDRFKIVNDTCGHNAGDELLRQISKVLLGQIRSSDTLARIGGDEFAIILYQYSKEKAMETAQRILTSVQQFHFLWEKQSFSIGVSIGLLSFNSQEDSLTSVIKAADTACYNAKNLGRSQIYVMQNKKQELAEQSQEMNWLSAIHQALELNHFVLYYQKIQPLQTQCSSLEHYEVLLRMKGENGQIIPPMAFIPIAERYQLMSQLDRWVIENFFAIQALNSGKQEQTNPQDSHSSLYAINLSGETLNDPNFVQFIKEAFKTYQIPPQLICFEITESVAIANILQAKLIITQLKELGCRFALDDFGSGMSSFGYLKSLPIDFLKIDGIFIREILQDPVNSFIVKSFHQVAQKMGIATIAEYIDSEEKLVQIKSLGIDYAQGYWIGKPQPLPKLAVVADYYSSVEI